jgi:hypothetical protein
VLGERVLEDADGLRPDPVHPEKVTTAHPAQGQQAVVAGCGERPPGGRPCRDRQGRRGGHTGILPRETRTVEAAGRGNG